MKLKRAIILFLSALLIAIGWWWFSEGKSVGNPRVEKVSFAVTDIDDERIKMTATVVLANRLPLKVRISRFHYKILVDSVLVLKASYSRPVEIVSGNKTTIKLPMEILAKPANDLIKQFKRTKADSASYTFLSSVYIEWPVIGETKFDFKKIVRGPAIQLYEVKVAKLKIVEFGVGNSKLHMNLVIENPGLTHFKASEMYYHFIVGDEVDVEGCFENEINIPPKQITTVPMELTVKTLKFGKLTWKRLVRKKDMPFNFNLRCKVIAHGDLLDHTNVTMNIRGTLNDLK